MRAAVALFVLAHIVPVVAADLVLRNPETKAELRLLEAPCEDATTRALIREEWLPHFKAARAKVRGQDSAGCWIESQGQVAVVFADGSNVTVPLSAFHDPSV